MASLRQFIRFVIYPTQSSSCRARDEHRRPVLERLEPRCVLTLPLYINVGGDEFLDGNLFVADQPYQEGQYGYMGGHAWTSRQSVDGTEDDGLYQDLRFGLPEVPFSYAVDHIASGEYEIGLHFFEPRDFDVGERLMTVKVEGQTVLENFDIISAAGAPQTAHVETIQASVLDGQLNIEFIAAADRVSLLSALTVASLRPAEADIYVVPSQLDFGKTPIDTTEEETITIYNLGQSTLFINGLTTSDSAYSVPQYIVPVEIPGGAKHDVTVTLHPDAEGEKNANLAIASSDEDEPVVDVPLFSQIIGPTRYVDVGLQTGITHMHQFDHSICNRPPIGSGSAWSDFDRDGDVDLYVTNHGGENFLYRNDAGPGEMPIFSEMAAEYGVADGGRGHGAVFIDYDNDGDQDLFLNNWGGNVLYKNMLSETGLTEFVDVTEQAGVQDSGRAITTAWGDFDNDGYLDFYLAKHSFCLAHEETDWTRDRLYRNNQDGTFSNATGALRSNEDYYQASGLGFSAAWLDYDNDHDLDLYLVNDNIDPSRHYPNVLWRNDGPGGENSWNFTDVSAESGANISLNGMGLGVGDFDNDQRLDLAMSNIGANQLLHNHGDGTFGNVSQSAGIERTYLDDGEVSVTWGTAFFDYDNNGWLDLLFVAGNIGEGGMPNAFFTNNQDGTFSDMSAESGLDEQGRGRSASIVDFDQDGYVDVFVGNYGGQPRLLHNRSIELGQTNSWLTVEVEGTISNRDGIGTRIYARTPDGNTQMREITSGPTHGGGDYKAAYFGLDEHDSVQLGVLWPSGIHQDLGTIQAGQKVSLVEPQFTNPNSRTDVDADGFTSAGDVVWIVDQLNRFGSSALPTARGSNSARLFVDVNGDHFRSAADVLAIVTEIDQPVQSRVLVHSEDGRSAAARSDVSPATDVLALLVPVQETEASVWQPPQAPVTSSVTAASEDQIGELYFTAVRNEAEAVEQGDSIVPDSDLNWLRLEDFVDELASDVAVSGTHPWSD